MPLTKSQSLLISCRALAPFVDVPLLAKQADGTVAPASNAAGIEIDQILKRLDQLDDEGNLHTIPDILDDLKRECWDAGYSLGMSPLDLLDDSQIASVDDLAKEVRISSVKA